MAYPSRYTANCRVQITDEDGNVYLLGIGTPFPFVTGVTLEIQYGSVSTGTIEIDAPFHEGLEMLGSSIFNYSNSVMITMGYPNSNSQTGVFVGSMLEGGSGLSLSPEGLTGSIAVANANLQTFFGKSAVVVSDIRNFLETEVKRAGYGGIEISDNADAVIQNIGNFKKSGFMTPLDNLQTFCRIYNLLWHLENQDGNNVFVIETLQDMLGKQATRMFVMRGGLFNQENIYPIINFAPEVIAAMFANRRAHRSAIRMSYINKDGEMETIEQTPQNVDVPQGSDKVEIEDARQINIDGVETARATDQTEAGTQMQVIDSETDNNATNEQGLLGQVTQGLKSVNASLTSVGIPEIQIQELVKVVGCGDIFDGVYKILQITHTWSGGEIETVLTLFRNEPVTSGGVSNQTVGEQ